MTEDYEDFPPRKWQRPLKVIMPLEESHAIAPLPKYFNQNTLDEKSKVVLKWLNGEMDRIVNLYNDC